MFLSIGPHRRCGLTPRSCHARPRAGEPSGVPRRTGDDADADALGVGSADPRPAVVDPQGWVVVKQGTLELTLDPRWTIDQQTSSGGEDTITASWNGRGDTVMAVSDYNPPRRLPAATLCGANAKASAKQMTKASDAPNLPNPMGDDRVETASCTVRGELDGTAYQIIFSAYQPWKGTRATVMQVRFRAKPFVSADAEPAARTTNLLQKFLIERTPKKG